MLQTAYPNVLPFSSTRLQKPTVSVKKAKEILGVSQLDVIRMVAVGMIAEAQIRGELRLPLDEVNDLVEWASSLRSKIRRKASQPERELINVTA